MRWGRAVAAAAIPLVGVATPAHAQPEPGVRYEVVTDAFRFELNPIGTDRGGDQLFEAAFPEITCTSEAFGDQVLESYQGLARVDEAGNLTGTFYDGFRKRTGTITGTMTNEVAEGTATLSDDCGKVTWQALPVADPAVADATRAFPFAAGPGSPASIAVTADAVYAAVAVGDRRTVVASFELESGRRTWKRSFNRRLAQPLADDDALWLSDEVDGDLLRIDPDDGSTVAVVEGFEALEESSATGGIVSMALDHGDPLVVTEDPSDTLWRVDAGTNKKTRLPLPDADFDRIDAVRLVAGEDALYYGNATGRVFRLDPDTADVEAESSDLVEAVVTDTPNALAAPAGAGPDAVVVVVDGDIAVLDPVTLALRNTIQASGSAVPPVVAPTGEILAIVEDETRGPELTAFDVGGTAIMHYPWEVGSFTVGTAGSMWAWLDGAGALVKVRA